MHVAKELLSSSFFKEDQSISMVMHREGDSLSDSFNPDSIFHPKGHLTTFYIYSVIITVLL